MPVLSDDVVTGIHFPTFHHPKIPLSGLSLSMEVLLKMTNRMNKKTTTSLPRLIMGLMSMSLAKYTPL